MRIDAPNAIDVSGISHLLNRDFNARDVSSEVKKKTSPIYLFLCAINWIRFRPNNITHSKHVAWQIVGI